MLPRVSSRPPRPIYHPEFLRKVTSMTALTPGQTHLMMTLLAFAEFDRDIAWVTRAELARHTGMHAQTVKRMLIELRRMGLVGDPTRELRGTFVQHGFHLLVRHAEVPENVRRSLRVLETGVSASDPAFSISAPSTTEEP